MTLSQLSRALAISAIGRAQGLHSVNDLVLLGYHRKKESNPGADSKEIGNWTRGLRAGLEALEEIDRESDFYKRAANRAETCLGRPLDDSLLREEYLEEIRSVWSNRVIVAINELRERRMMRIQRPSNDMLDIAMYEDEGNIH